MINTLYAIIGMDPQDGIIVVQNPQDGTPLPMVSPSYERMLQFYPSVKEEAKKLGKEIRILKFDQHEDITAFVESELAQNDQQPG